MYALVVRRRVALLIRGYSKSDQEDMTADELAQAVADVERLRPVAEQVVRETDAGEG